MTPWYHRNTALAMRTRCGRTKSVLNCMFRSRWAWFRGTPASGHASRCVAGSVSQLGGAARILNIMSFAAKLNPAGGGARNGARENTPLGVKRDTCSKGLIALCVAHFVPLQLSAIQPKQR